MKYQELGNAVIIQAVEDWRTAMDCLKRRPDNLPAEEMRRDCEKFFRSGWFALLSDVNGEQLLKTLKGEMRDER